MPQKRQGITAAGTVTDFNRIPFSPQPFGYDTITEQR
jgi:hypothetical protein